MNHERCYIILIYVYFNHLYYTDNICEYKTDVHTKHVNTAERFDWNFQNNNIFERIQR